MSMFVQEITENFAAAPQLSPADMPAVAAAGYKSIIINRPDYEDNLNQPTAAEVSEAAAAIGIAVVHQPVVRGAMTQADVARFAELLCQLPAPILAYCYTGARCTQLFHQAQALIPAGVDMAAHADLSS